MRIACVAIDYLIQCAFGNARALRKFIYGKSCLFPFLRNNSA
nr:MAG TPA: Protein of unknown function (DUF4497) [Caudoviricetes sp.]